MCKALRKPRQHRKWQERGGAEANPVNCSPGLHDVVQIEHTRSCVGAQFDDAYFPLEQTVQLSQLSPLYPDQQTVLLKESAVLYFSEAGIKL